MIFKLFTIGLLVAVLNSAYAQDSSSGVFLTMKPTKNSKDYTKIVSQRDGSKRFYVPLNPIISAKEFEKVSEITNDEVLRSTFFYLFFTQKGIDNLKMMAKVEGGQLVLVVDNVVIGHIKTVGVAANRSIQINGPLNSLDVMWAHTSLLKLFKDREGH